MNTYKYQDPLVVLLRKGTVDDPYVDKAETLKVINGLIILNELPDEFTHVTITGYTEIYKGSPTATQFIVNYQNGIATMNTSEEGKSLSVSYKGRGIIQYPAERIYAHTSNNPNVVQNLQEIIDNGQVALDSVATLSEIVIEADAAIANATTAATSANTAASGANVAKTNADNAATAANTAATSATNAATSATNAANSATTAATNAHTAEIAANTAAGNAETARTNADNAAYNANNKATLAQTAATAANTATTAANTATVAANDAASAANTAKINADTAATSANDAAITANTAATAANTAANNTKHVGDWSATTAYYKNNSVFYNNTLYICILDAPIGTLPTSATYWQVGVSIQSAVTAANDAANTATTAATAANTATANANNATNDANTAASSANTAATSATNAATAANLVSDNFVHRGAYDPAATYKKHNIVRYNGSSYQCISDVDVTGVVPTDISKWELSAQKGVDGTGAVSNISSTNSDITVINPTTTPTLTLNSGDGANQIVKRNPDGKIASPNFIGNATFDNDVLIQGKLQVAGPFETISSTNTNILDSEITLNAGTTGTPALDALITVERGTSANVSVKWNETITKWQITNDGTTFNNIVHEGDVATSGANTIVRRDSNGDVLGNITGNAATATNANAVGGQTLTNLDTRFAAFSHSHATATASVDGFLSASDKTKLDSIASGAGVNQNAFSKIAVSGQLDIDADSQTDALTVVAGNGIQLTTNQTTDSLTVDFTGSHNGALSVYGTSDVVTSVIKGSSGQTANLQEWQTFDGTVKIKVEANGDFTIRGGKLWADSWQSWSGAPVTVTQSAIAASAMKIQQTASNANVPIFIVQAGLTPDVTGHIQAWRNSVDADLAFVDRDGGITGNSFKTKSYVDYVSLGVSPTAVAGRMYYDGTAFKYSTDGTTWKNVGTGAGGTGGSSIKRHEFTATEGQTDFIIPSSYEMGTNKLEVYVGGFKQAESAYTELSVNSIRLSEGVPVGTTVEIVWFEAIALYSGGVVVNTEEFTASGGQTVFTITKGTYEVGSNSLEVYIDGIRQYVTTSYTETSSTVFTFTEGLTVGQKVLVRWYERYNFTAHAASHAPGAGDDISTWYMPKTGGIFTGTINVSGSTGKGLQLNDTTLSKTMYITMENGYSQINSNQVIKIISNSGTTGLQVSGDNVSVGGNLTVNGNTIIGNASTDTLQINAYVSSDIIPNTDGTKFLGGSDNQWYFIYTKTLVTHNFLGGTVFTAQVDGDTDERFLINAEGTIYFGPGNDFLDTNLYRSAANTLKTDDSLIVTGSLTVNSTTTINSNLTVSGDIVNKEVSKRKYRTMVM